LLCHESGQSAAIERLFRACVSEHVTKKAQMSITYCVYELITGD